MDARTCHSFARIVSKEKNPRHDAFVARETQNNENEIRKTWNKVKITSPTT
jgi:hypothetical protein